MACLSLKISAWYFPEGSVPELLCCHRDPTCQILLRSNIFSANIFEANIFEANIFSTNIFEVNIFSTNIFQASLSCYQLM